MNVGEQTIEKGYACAAEISEIGSAKRTAQTDF